MEGIVSVLKHDLHKMKIPGFLPHKKSLSEENMKTADRISSWFSRNSEKNDFNLEDRLYIRSSFILNIEEKQIKNQIHQNRIEIFEIFKESDPLKLHFKILNSQLLNKFSEAIQYPYSSFKFHLLLTCAIYYNLCQGFQWHKLYLCENGEKESQYQIIYQDKDREWALLPNGGMSRVHPKFSITWVRRTILSIGGVEIILDQLLSQIESWSAALATIEDWQQIE